MTPADRKPGRKPDEKFRHQVKASQQRKLRAKRRGDQGVWFGLGMFGLVGWSVAIPALVAIAVGIWLDARLTSQYSWTLMLLVLGVGVGCLNAWFWVSRERRDIEAEFQRGRNEGKDGDDSGDH